MSAPEQFDIPEAAVEAAAKAICLDDCQDSRVLFEQEWDKDPHLYRKQGRLALTAAFKAMGMEREEKDTMPWHAAHRYCSTWFPTKPSL